MARKVADRKGLSLTGAVREALREKLERESAEKETARRLEKLQQIAKGFSNLPILDDRTDDEIIGYDELGIPR
jgi:antitoxin VapB